MPQSARLRQEYLRLAETLLAQERADIGRNLGSAPDALERHLKEIDRARALSAELEAAEVVGLDEPRMVDALDEYADADHLLQPTMDACAATIDVAVARAGLVVPAETYTCVLPTGTLNAQSRASTGGVLVLVNTGLVMFLWQVTQAISHVVDFSTWTAYDSGLIGDRLTGSRLYTHDQMSGAYTGAVLAYLAFGDSTRTRRVAPQGGVRGQLLEAMYNATQLFVIAHEFGHVIAGHVSDASTKRLGTSGWDDVALAAKTLDQEFEADRLAVRLVASLADGAGNPQARWVMSLGVFLFLALVDSIERVRIEGLDLSPGEADHPPTEQRISAARAEILTRFHPRELEPASTAIAWLEQATANTIDLIRKARQQSRAAD